ncbi:MAG TPA: hypothetical protein VFG86_16330, partial [Chloroflexota bacterium]|nr:hypothetical protein [Chloroflexota bacterium]
MLMLRNGQFAFVDVEAPVDRDITLSGDELRNYLDQLQSSEDKTAPLPSLDAVPQPVVDPSGSATADQLVLDSTSVQVLMLVDGHRTVREVVGDKLLLPRLRSLAQLRERGLIEFDAEAALGGAAPEVGLEGTCPKLGFADDPTRHYARSTALHRCFATEVPSLITSQEQRGLCLGGGFPSCSRFRAAASSVAQPVQTVPRALPEGTLPLGVPSQLAAAQSMSVARPLVEPVPDWIGEDKTVTSVGHRVPPSRMALVLVGLGAALSLLAIFFALLLVPTFLPRLVRAQPTPPPAAAVQATVAPPPRPSSQPTAPPTSAPKPAPVAAVASVVAPSPTPDADVLSDVRLAAAAPRDWLNSAPFAGWRDGAYRLSAQQATRFVAVGLPLSLPDDVVVLATMRKTGGPPGGGYGVIVRGSEPEVLDGTNQAFDGYVFESGDLGEYGIWRREGDRWIDLVPWTRSQAVRQGGSPNELLVKATGVELTFTINGIEVARINDDVLSHGGVGVFAGGDNNEVALDRFALRIPR